MVVDADRAAAFPAQGIVGLREGRLAIREARAAAQVHPREVRAHLEDVEHAAVVEGLIVDADVVGLVQVHPNAHVAQGGVRLRRPRAPRLPIGHRDHAEDPVHVPSALGLASKELRPPVVPAGVLQVDGNRRLLAVRVRVIADVVPLERGNHITPPPLFEHPRLFADDLERGPHTHPRQHLGETLRRIVIRRQDVVLGVEPEHHVDGWGDVLADRPG